MSDAAPSDPQPEPEVPVRAVIGGHEYLVEFIPHALDRMAQRGILYDDIVRCLRRPDEKNLDTDEGRSRWGRYGVDGRRLDVIFERTDESSAKTIVVISAMWYSGSRR